MMEKKITHTLVRNSVTGIITQIIVTGITFILRRVLVLALGVESVGIINTFISVIGTLSLVDLGMDSVFLHNFFEPLSKNDLSGASEFLTMFKKIYSSIGIIILCAGFVVMLFCGHFVTGVSASDKELRLIFLLLLMATAVTYFFSYNRTLLIAAQMQYICLQCDMMVKLFGSIMEIILLYLTNDIYLYLMMEIAKNFLSNYIIHRISKKKFPYIRSNQKGMECDKKTLLYSDIRNGLTGKVAGYIYSSTDNILISTFFSTSYVGYLSNYNLAVTGIKVVIHGLINPIQSYTGKYLNEDRTDENKAVYFYRYSLMLIFLSTMIVIAFQSLINIFISVWLGEAYILPWYYPLLLSYILFLNIVESLHEQVIVGGGLFRENKKIALTGAIINIVVSIMSLQVFGIAGVYIGTIVSEVFLWIAKTKMIFNMYLKMSCFMYWKKIVCTVFFFVMIDLIVADISDRMKVGATNGFIILVLAEMLMCLIFFLSYRNSDEYKFWLGIGKKIVSKREK